jgi:hypothetical protein
VTSAKTLGTLRSTRARHVLDAAYAATLISAVLNLNAIERALTMFAKADPDVIIVSYGKSDPRIQRLVDNISKSG